MSEYGTRYMTDADGETWAQSKCSWRDCDNLVPPFITRYDMGPFRRYCTVHQKQGKEIEIQMHREEAQAERFKVVAGWVVAIVALILLSGEC